MLGARGGRGGGGVKTLNTLGVRARVWHLRPEKTVKKGDSKTMTQPCTLAVLRKTCFVPRLCA